jgi:hypothetical protein
MLEQVIPWYFFDAASIDLEPDRETLKAPDASNTGGKIYCRSCRNLLTCESQTIRVAGQESYTCINPAGVKYNFRCFRDAPGCAVSGTATGEHSWFPGYKWQIAICGNCTGHLGWFFSGTGSFFGLIAVRLLYQET